MNVKPLSDRVLILPNPAEEKTAGKGETAGRQSNRRWSRYFGNQDGSQSRRSGALRQVCRSGDQRRWHGLPDYEAAGYSGYHLISSVGLKKLRLWQKR